MRFDLGALLGLHLVIGDEMNPKRVSGSHAIEAFIV